MEGIINARIAYPFVEMMRLKINDIRNNLNLFKSKAGRDVLLPVADSFLMEMADDGALTVKGCHELLTYSENCVDLLTDRFLLSLRGKDLIIETFSENLTSVKGTIESIIFDR